MNETKSEGATRVSLPNPSPSSPVAHAPQTEETKAWTAPEHVEPVRFTIPTEEQGKPRGDRANTAQGQMGLIFASQEALAALAVLRSSDRECPIPDISPALRSLIYSAHDLLLAALQGLKPGRAPSVPNGNDEQPAPPVSPNPVAVPQEQEEWKLAQNDPRLWLDVHGIQHIFEKERLERR
jgi:hypothetical protein